MIQAEKNVSTNGRWSEEVRLCVGNVKLDAYETKLVGSDILTYCALTSFDAHEVQYEKSQHSDEICLISYFNHRSICFFSSNCRRSR